MVSMNIEYCLVKLQKIFMVIVKTIRKEMMYSTRRLNKATPQKSFVFNKGIKIFNGKLYEECLSDPVY